MELSKILSKLFNTQLIIGAEIIFTDGDEVECRVVLIKKTGNFFEIASSSNGVDALKQSPLKNYPTVITVSGKNIIHKRFSTESGNQSKEEIFKGLFPNSSVKDFYIQKTTEDNGEGFISIIRQEVLDKILSSFDKVTVIDLFFSPFPIVNLLGLMENNNYKKRSLTISSYNLVIR